MILRPVTSGSEAATSHLTRSAPSGPDKENGWKWPQKGDFAGQMSFAIASLMLTLQKPRSTVKLDFVFNLDRLVLDI